MFEVTLSAKPDSFPSETHELIFKNREILNFIFGEYIKNGESSLLSSVMVNFGREKLDIIKTFIQYGLLQQSEAQTDKRALLTFAGFLYGNSNAIKTYRATMYNVFESLLGWFCNSRKEVNIEIDELCREIMPRVWVERKKYIITVIKIMETAPIAIMQLHWRRDNDVDLDLKEVKVLDRIFAFKDADEYLRACFGVLQRPFTFSESRIDSTKQQSTHASNKPIIFISYAAEELALADFVKEVLMAMSENKVETFVAKRDIPSGDNPLKVMMEEKLRNARAIIPICSIKSKDSSWVWWESAVVWAKGFKIYPLFTNISAENFGAPLTLVCQGKEYFSKEEFVQTLSAIFKDLKIDIKMNGLLKEKTLEYDKLRDEYSKAETSAKVSVRFKKLEMTQDLHEYSFIFEIDNRTRRKFDDVIVEIFFPVDYMEKKHWDYPHLHSLAPKDKPDYLCLVFSYSGLNDIAKSTFLNGLLPGHKLRLFGENGITNLIYKMDNERYERRFKYDIQWKVYVDGGAPQEGNIPLDVLQCF